MFLLLAGCATSASPTTTRTIAFTNMNLIPMTRETVIENQTVLVKGSEIVTIGDPVTLKIPRGAQVIDGKGAYLMPGGIYFSDANYSDSAPGDQHAYSNVAFALIGFMVECLSGESFTDYCREHLFAPLEMTRSTWMLANVAPGEFTFQYVPDPSGNGKLPGEHVVIRLTDEVRYAMWPAWSPDGSRLAYVDEPGGNLLLVKADRSDATYLKSGVFGSPIWRPERNDK